MANFRDTIYKLQNHQAIFIKYQQEQHMPIMGCNKIELP